MESTRRDVLTAAVTLAGATATHDLAHADDHAHSEVPSDVALRVKSLESLLVEKGLINQAALDALIDIYEHKVGPRNGARVVARAWVDPAYKQRLLASGTAAIGSSAIPAIRAQTSGWSRIRPKYTTWWFAPCAPVIRGQSLASLRSGTSLHRTGRVR